MTDSRPLYAAKRYVSGWYVVRPDPHSMGWFHVGESFLLDRAACEREVERLNAAPVEKGKTE